MLPESSLDPVKSQQNPYMFADTGLPRLFRECYQLGAHKPRLQVKVAGGSQVLGSRECFQIGRRNFAALRKIFLKNKKELHSRIYIRDMSHHFNYVCQD